MKIDTLLETEQKSSKVAPWMSWEYKSSNQNKPHNSSIILSSSNNIFSSILWHMIV